MEHEGFLPPPPPPRVPPPKSPLGAARGISNNITGSPTSSTVKLVFRRPSMSAPPPPPRESDEPLHVTLDGNGSPVLASPLSSPVQNSPKAVFRRPSLVPPPPPPDIPPPPPRIPAAPTDGPILPVSAATHTDSTLLSVPPPPPPRKPVPSPLIGVHARVPSPIPEVAEAAEALDDELVDASTAAVEASISSTSSLIQVPNDSSTQHKNASLYVEDSLLPAIQSVEATVADSPSAASASATTKLPLADASGVHVQIPASFIDGNNAVVVTDTAKPHDAPAIRADDAAGGLTKANHAAVSVPTMSEAASLSETSLIAIPNAFMELTVINVPTKVESTLPPQSVQLIGDAAMLELQAASFAGAPAPSPAQVSTSESKSPTFLQHHTDSMQYEEEVQGDRLSGSASPAEMHSDVSPAVSATDTDPYQDVILAPSLPAVMLASVWDTIPELSESPQVINEPQIAGIPAFSAAALVEDVLAKYLPVAMKTDALVPPRTVVESVPEASAFSVVSATSTALDRVREISSPIVPVATSVDTGGSKRAVAEVPASVFEKKHTTVSPLKSSTSAFAHAKHHAEPLHRPKAMAAGTRAAAAASLSLTAPSSSKEATAPMTPETVRSPPHTLDTSLAIVDEFVAFVRGIQQRSQACNAAAVDAGTHAHAVDGKQPSLSRTSEAAASAMQRVLGLQPEELLRELQCAAFAFELGLPVVQSLHDFRARRIIEFRAALEQSHAALVVALREAEAVRDELTGIGSDRQRRLIHEQLPQSIIMTLMQHRTLSTSRSGDAAVIQSPVRHKLLTNVNGIDAVEAFRKVLSNSPDSIPRSCAGISCEELSSVHAVCAAACPSTTDLDQLHESPASPEVIECKQILGKAATTLLDKQYSAAQAQYNAARKQTQALTHLLHRQRAELQSTQAAKANLAAALKGLRTESQALLGSHSADVALYEKKLKEFEQHALPSVFARIAEAEEATRFDVDAWGAAMLDEVRLETEQALEALMHPRQWTSEQDELAFKLQALEDDLKQAAELANSIRQRVKYVSTELQRVQADIRMRQDLQRHKRVMRAMWLKHKTPCDERVLLLKECLQAAPYSTELFHELQSMHAALVARSRTTGHSGSSPPSTEPVIPNASELILSMKPSHACPINVDEAQEVSVDKGLLREEVAAAPAVKSKEVLAYFRNVVRKQLALMKQ